MNVEQFLSKYEVDLQVAPYSKTTIEYEIRKTKYFKAEDTKFFQPTSNIVFGTGIPIIYCLEPDSCFVYKIYGYSSEIDGSYQYTRAFKTLLPNNKGKINDAVVFLGGNLGLAITPVDSMDTSLVVHLPYFVARNFTHLSPKLSALLKL